MPGVREAHRVVAVSITDLHLSHDPPAARSCHDDWYEVQAGYLGQVRILSKRLGDGPSPCPVVCCGDVFDDGWRPGRHPPELTNFALKYLPDRMYAIPGQHDLPHHRYKDVRKSAFWTLVKAGVITPLGPDMNEGRPLEVGNLRLWGFPWGVEVHPPHDGHDLMLDVAVVHAYAWVKGSGYPGAPKDKRARNYEGKLKGYDLALFGDNHQTFKARVGDCLLFNGGSFMRRKLDEIQHRPCVGLIYNDGRVEPHYLDTSGDRFLEVGGELKEVMGGIGFETLMEEIRNLADAAIDFGEAVRTLLEREKVHPRVKQLILHAMGGRKR